MVLTLIDRRRNSETTYEVTGREKKRVLPQPMTLHELRDQGYLILACTVLPKYIKGQIPDFLHESCGFCAVMRKGMQYFFYSFQNDGIRLDGLSQGVRLETISVAHSLYSGFGPYTGRIVEHERAFPHYQEYMWRAGQPRGATTVPESFAIHFQYLEQQREFEWADVVSMGRNKRYPYAKEAK